MRILIDQNLPPDTAANLRNLGVDAVHTQECGLRRAGDDEILAYCQAESLVIVSRDADFHALLAASGASSPSVVRLRLESVTAVDVAAVIVRVLSDFREDLLRGVAVSVGENSVRLHDLPLKEV